MNPGDIPDHTLRQQVADLRKQVNDLTARAMWAEDTTRILVAAIRQHKRNKFGTSPNDERLWSVLDNDRLWQTFVIRDGKNGEQ